MWRCEYDRTPSLAYVCKPVPFPWPEQLVFLCSEPVMVEYFQDDVIWEHVDCHMSSKRVYSEQEISTRVNDCAHAHVHTVRRAGNNRRVVMVKRKAPPFLPPHRRPIPHPLGFGKYVGNSRIDCCDDGARREHPSDDKTRIAITQRISMLGSPIGQHDSCNRMG